MNQKELNEYIKHYLEKDKTQSAIMLSAPWGTNVNVNIFLFPIANQISAKM